MAKVRNHNEWFRPVSLGGRKSCPCCKAKLEHDEQIWSWGQYVRAKWQTVQYFCKNCFVEEVQVPLLEHSGPCGCTISLVGYHCQLPEWLTLEVADVGCPVAA